jgi:hypothetical protein
MAANLHCQLRARSAPADGAATRRACFSPPGAAMTKLTGAALLDGTGALVIQNDQGLNDDPFRQHR